MASSPTRHEFQAPDGVTLAWYELGEGRPVVLLHGLFSSADVNWVRFGTAAEIAGRGFRVIMPDLRAHGASDSPHDPAAYPPDILAADGAALVAHLGLEDYDLGGYSLGGRTAARMVVGGAAPRRLIIGGMGIDGLTATGRRADHFKHVLDHLGSHERGSEAWMAEAFLKTAGGDPKALRPLLDSFVDTSRAELATIAMPTQVVCGAEDDDNGSAEALAEALPQGEYWEIPGNHMNAITRRDFGHAIADFLAR